MYNKGLVFSKEDIDNDENMGSSSERCVAQRKGRLVARGFDSIFNDS
jgi:hypothetical protein